MKNIRNTKIYKEMTIHNACAITEGFYIGQTTKEERIAAWQYLVDSGASSIFQGWYGRMAQSLIKDKIIKPKKK